MGAAELEHLRMQIQAAVSLARVPSEQSVPGRVRTAAQPLGSVAQDSVVRRKSCLRCAWKSLLLTGVADKAVGVHPPLISAFAQTPEFTC